MGKTKEFMKSGSDTENVRRGSKSESEDSEVSTAAKSTKVCGN